MRSARDRCRQSVALVVRGHSIGITAMPREQDWLLIRFSAGSLGTTEGTTFCFVHFHHWLHFQTVFYKLDDHIKPYPNKFQAIMTKSCLATEGCRCTKPLSRQEFRELVPTSTFSYCLLLWKVTILHYSILDHLLWINQLVNASRHADRMAAQDRGEPFLSHASRTLYNSCVNMQLYL